MNIFKFEIKNVLRQAILWAITLCLVLFSFSLLYPAFSAGKQELTKVLSGYPPAFAAAFGLNLTLIFSFNGFYSFILMYINLTVAIMALYFGIMIFSREKRTKTSDFLLSKPIGRNQIFFEKFIAAFLTVLFVDFLLTALTVSIFFTSDTGGASYGDFMLMVIGVVILSYFFLSVGILIAHLMPKVKSPSGIAVSCGFIFFIITMVQGIVQEDFMKYLSPMKYFVGDNVTINHSYDPVFLTISIIVILGSIVFSYFNFIRKDIHSV
jgi:ABC-2 type transport system permease protein